MKNIMFFATIITMLAQSANAMIYMCFNDIYTKNNNNLFPTRVVRASGGDWEVADNEGNTYRGVALCGHSSVAVMWRSGQPAETYATTCACKMAYPYLSDWVGSAGSTTTYASHTECINKCAQSCANKVTGYTSSNSLKLTWANIAGVDGYCPNAIQDYQWYADKFSLASSGAKCELNGKWPFGTVTACPEPGSNNTSNAPGRCWMYTWTPYGTGTAGTYNNPEPCIWQ